jgi:hypothetical protein
VTDFSLKDRSQTGLIGVLADWLVRPFRPWLRAVAVTVRVLKPPMGEVRMAFVRRVAQGGRPQAARLFRMLIVSSSVVALAAVGRSPEAQSSISPPLYRVPG